MLLLDLVRSHGCASVKERLRNLQLRALHSDPQRKTGAVLLGAGGPGGRGRRGDPGGTSGGSGGAGSFYRGPGSGAVRFLQSGDIFSTPSPCSGRTRIPRIRRSWNIWREISAAVPAMKDSCGDCGIFWSRSTGAPERKEACSESCQSAFAEKRRHGSGDGQAGVPGGSDPGRHAGGEAFCGAPTPTPWWRRSIRKKARGVPGVEAVYTWEDVPGQRFTMAGQTYPEPSPYDRLILDRHVRYVGDPVAIVAAGDRSGGGKSPEAHKSDLPGAAGPAGFPAGQG